VVLGFILAIVIAPIAAKVASKIEADSAANREYQIKAAFLYNFVKFVDWPAEETADVNQPIIIGILGTDPFGDAFEPVKDTHVKGRKVSVERFKSLGELKKDGEQAESELRSQINAIRKCHLLFICSSEKGHLGEIIESLKGMPVLTISELDDFAESGGIIELTMEEEKVRFEINLHVAEKADLKIRSQLLRLAKKVINGGGSSPVSSGRSSKSTVLGMARN
jgi:hypothetical protein